MGQSSLNFNADEDHEDEEPGGDALPDSTEDRDSDSLRSPNFELAATSDPVGDAARSADASSTNAASGGDGSSDAQSDSSAQSDAWQGSQSWQPSQSQSNQNAPTPQPAQVASTLIQQSGTDSGSGDALAQPAASGASPAGRQRQPARQIGQIPDADDSWIYNSSFAGSGGEKAAQLQDRHAAFMQGAQQSQARWDQIAQVNASDPYISNDDGRWKKQQADPATGAVNEMDVLDNGIGKIDRGTGNIYVQTAQGPQVIGADPRQQRLAQIVAQKAQAQAQGSQSAADIAAAQSSLADTQRQLSAFQGVPERMSAQVAKYTQASLDPDNTAAADQLQNAQAALSNWKQQNPRYAALAAKRDALANQIQTQTAAKAQSDAQLAQLLTNPQYIQWNGSTPSAPAQASSGQGVSTANGSGAAPDGSDISIHDLDARAGVIAAQTGFPPGVAYASALGEAKQRGAQSVDGSSIDDAIQGVQPVAQAQLPKMTGPQLRQAFQAGLITRRQAQMAATARNAAQDQGASNVPNLGFTTTQQGANASLAYPTGQQGANTSLTSGTAQQAASASLPYAAGQQADPVAQSVADLTAKAADLRAKIQTAFDTGGADGATDLATYRAALADTEGQLHAVAQTLLNRVPPAIQARILRAVAPDLDWDAASRRNAQDPMANFGFENLGAALRDQVMPTYQQRGVRKLASANGVNPDLADHIANQAIGANAVRDLITVLRGGNIDQARAQTLQDMGFLRPSDPGDPTSPLHLTEDAQGLLPPGGQKLVQFRPDVARYTPSPDPAPGSALYQNAVAGMENIANTAQKMLPASPPAPDSNAVPTQRQPIIPGLPHPLDLPGPSPLRASIVPGIDDASTAQTDSNPQSPGAITDANGNADRAPAPRQPIIPGIPHPLDLPGPSPLRASIISGINDASTAQTDSNPQSPGATTDANGNADRAPTPRQLIIPGLPHPLDLPAPSPLRASIIPGIDEILTAQADSNPQSPGATTDANGNADRAPAPRQPIIPGIPHPLELPDPSPLRASIISGIDDASTAPTGVNAQSGGANTDANGNTNPAPGKRQPIIPGLPHPLDLPDPSSPWPSVIPRLNDVLSAPPGANAQSAGANTGANGNADPAPGKRAPIFPGLPHPLDLANASSPWASAIPGLDASQNQSDQATPQDNLDFARRRDAAASRVDAIQQRLQQLAQYPELTSSEQQEQAQLQSERNAINSYVSGDIPAYQKWVNDHGGADADAQAKQVMADRDNPAAGTLASHFNWGPAVVDDAVRRDRDADILFDRAHPDGGSVWARIKRDAGQFVSSDVPTYMGMRQQDLDAVSKAEQARQLIGNLTNVQDVKDVLAAQGPLGQTLDAGGNIVTPANVQSLVQKIQYHSQAEADAAQPPAMDQDKVPLPNPGEGSQLGLSKSGVHLSLTLGEAQAYLNALRDNDSGASASVAENALVNSIPFVTSGDIAIDENDKQQVAQRAALSMALAKEISEHHGGAQMAGGAIGGLASFLGPELAFKNIGVVGKLGAALNEIGWAKSADAGIDAISKAATIATLAGSDELKANPQSQNMLATLVGAAARAFALATSMKVGGTVEKGIGSAADGLGAVPRVLAGGAASAAGVTAMDATQRALSGQDPTDIGAGQLAGNAGTGLAMSLLGLKALRGEAAFQQAWKARDNYIQALTIYNQAAYDPAAAPPAVGDLMAREAVLRQQLQSAKTVAAQDPLKAQLQQNLAQQKAAIDAQKAATGASPANPANPNPQSAPQPNPAPSLGAATPASGLPVTNSAQPVPSGTNPAKADPVTAATPPQAQAPGGTSDAGKANAPGSGAPPASDGSPADAKTPDKASGTDSAKGNQAATPDSVEKVEKVEKDIDAITVDKSDAAGNINPKGSPAVGRRMGTLFTNYDALRTFLIKHNVLLSVDPPGLAKPLNPHIANTAASFYPLEGQKAMFYLRSDATRYEVLHELGHFAYWLEQGKPSDLGDASEQAAYDFIRNNPTRWQSLNDAERHHANTYLLEKGGTPNLRRN